MALCDRRTVYRGLVAGVLVAALGLSACGRNGPLEAPPPAVTTPNADGTTPPPPPDHGPVKPQKKFFLDWLL